jgi:hypothetical protein
MQQPKTKLEIERTTMDMIMGFFYNTDIGRIIVQVQKEIGPQLVAMQQEDKDVTPAVLEDTVLPLDPQPNPKKKKK